MRDIRYAIRVLLKAPGFTAIAVIILALGIGANTAIFSVVSGVLLRPLPFAHPKALVQLNESDTRNGIGAVSVLDLEDWRQQSPGFEAMIAYSNLSKNLQESGEPERVAAVAADRGLFRMLGVAPILGRTFRDDDPPNVVVIGQGFWQRRYGSDPALIGKKINLDGEGFAVIGVMPEKFQFPYRASFTELWIPREVPPEYARNRRYRADFATGRLRPGVTLDRARSELDVIAKRLAAAYPDTNADKTAVITPLSEVVTGSVRSRLLTLLGAVGLVVLIACANVANLLLERAASRTHEVAVRAALGASPSQLVRQFLAESMLLAMAGGAAGLMLGSFGTALLLKLAASQIPRSWEIGIDWRVFTFLFVLCVTTGVGFGLAPALAALRVDVQAGLKKTATRGTAGRSEGVLRDALVVAEIALAFVLLAGAGLLLRAFIKLENTPTGLVAENVLTLRMTVSQAQYKTNDAVARYFRDLAERIETIPGVRSAGLIQILPYESWGWTGWFSIEGRPGETGMSSELRFVTPGYFRALGIPILRGRGFTDRDNREVANVILINEALARRYFPNQDPVGLKTDRGTIAGVVGDVWDGPGHRPAPEIFVPLAQNTVRGATLVVSVQMHPEALMSAVRDAIHLANPNQAVFNITPMQRVIANSLSDLNVYLWLMGLFATLALLLAVAGIYGVISYAVTARTREFGIRLALGADRRRLLGSVLGHGAVLAAIGLAVGAAGAFGLTRILKSLLEGVTPTDPATFAAVALLLSLVALMACFIPARRAANVDPMIALRYE